MAERMVVSPRSVGFHCLFMASFTLRQVASNPSATSKADEDLEIASRAVQLAKQIYEETVAREASLIATQKRLEKSLLDQTLNADSVRCMIQRTRCNASVEATEFVVGAVCATLPVAEDQHELCELWANEGACEQNPKYMHETCQRSCVGRTGALPKSSAAVASSCSQTRPSEVLSEQELADIWAGDRVCQDEDEAAKGFRQDVRSAAAALEAAREHEQTAMTAMADPYTRLESAENAEKEAALHESETRAAHAAVQSELVDTADGVVKHWVKLVGSNVTSTKLAIKDFLDRRDDHRRLRKAADDAASLEHSLRKAHRMADETATKRSESLARIATQCDALRMQIANLSAAVSTKTNFTSVLATWMPSASTDGNPRSTFVPCLKRVVRRALIDIVGSIEATLDSYVFATDRRVENELAWASSDLKLLDQRLRSANAAVTTAVAQERDARNIVNRAAVATQQMLVAVEEAAARLSLAGEAASLAEAALNESRLGLAGAEEQLHDAQRTLDFSRTQIEAAAAEQASFASLTQDRQNELINAHAVVEAATADVEKAETALSAAQVALAAAEALAEHRHEMLLQAECNPNEQEFNVYRLHRAPLSLVKAAIAGAEAARLAAETRRREAMANQSAVEFALQAIRDDPGGAEHAQQDRSAGSGSGG